MRLKISKADKLFSLVIRHRDNFTCQRCNFYDQPPTMQIHCAHFQSRAKKSVRWDTENACALCQRCHLYFDGYSPWGMEKHEREFKDFFLKRLGQKRYDLLILRANTITKMDESLIVLWSKSELEKMGVRNYK